MGLRPFEKSDTHLFFGRDLQINESLSRLRTQRFVVVMGTSGSGKSSLIRARLFSPLEGGFISTVEGSWRIAVLRPAQPDSETSLRRSHACCCLSRPRANGHRTGDLRSICGEGRSASSMRFASRASAERGPLLVVVDQFEELFRFKTARSNAARGHAVAFVKLLLEAARHRELPVLRRADDAVGVSRRLLAVPGPAGIHQRGLVSSPEA